MSAESKVLFLGVQYLRDNTIINDNCDGNVLQQVIRTAQVQYIQSIIGSSLHDKLIADILANTVTGNYEILLNDYVIPCLLQYSLYESIPFITYKFRNKGVQKQTSDTSSAVDLTELSYIRDNVKNAAEFYAARLAKYLIMNPTLFPEYRQGWEDLQANTERYFSGVFVPRSRGRGLNPLYINSRYDEGNINLN